MLKKILLSLVLAAAFTGAAFSPPPVYATTHSSTSAENPCTSTSICNPLKDVSVYKIAGYIIRGLLGLVGVIALVMFMWGGAQMMFSQGNPAKYKEGINTLVWSVFGIAVIFGSYALVDFVLRTILGESLKR